MLTNAYAVRGRPTLKDVSERFWTGPFRELKAIKEKSKQTMKSNEQNKLMSKYEQIMARNGKQMTTNDETMTKNLTINSCTEKYYSDSDEYQTPDQAEASTLMNDDKKCSTTVAILEEHEAKHSNQKNHSTRKNLFKLVNIEVNMITLVLFCLLLVVSTMNMSQNTTFGVVLPIVSLAMLCIISVLVSYVLSSTEAAISNIFDDHDIVEKAMQLYVNIHHDDSMTIKMRKDCRSRYAKFVYYNHNRVVCYCHGGRRQKNHSCEGGESLKLAHSQPEFIYSHFLAARPPKSGCIRKLIIRPAE